MIKFEDVVKTIKGLNNVEILSENAESHEVFFKKGGTSYILSKPNRTMEDPEVSFAISMVVQPSELRDEKLTYIEILEIINFQNSISNDLCKTYYKKDSNTIVIEAKHILFGTDTSIYINSINNRLSDYLIITTLGMLIIIMETLGRVAHAISSTLKDKNGNNNNEKNK